MLRYFGDTHVACYKRIFCVSVVTKEMLLAEVIGKPEIIFFLTNKIILLLFNFIFKFYLQVL